LFLIRHVTLQKIIEIALGAQYAPAQPEDKSGHGVGSISTQLRGPFQR
jgi:hypothetical protein